ncbi:PREDICTED: uncharacterized protein LOC104608985 [Nelumbo nucifera]|uniref:Uncharacterized protein LOC104608985 n=2 Tax=Nelumbo nucifera TaxID=4432 RepID=A0A1U8BB87_NELNU|nr:PREDICTED: uncharacterized protein LOC104608985 [Nelumbo nucifera]DAD37682.1 TPA_asm: hypothetical protein HUJ06_008323 [Nelumbo nucifera]
MRHFSSPSTHLLFSSLLSDYLHPNILLTVRSVRTMMKSTTRIPYSGSFLLLLLFQTVSPPAPLPAEAFSVWQWRTLISLSHSLMNRVANLRASRGDYEGSMRARRIAEKLEGGMGVGLGLGLWSVGWDYLKNYAWREMAWSEMAGAVSDMNELLKGLNELTRMGSDKDRAAWVAANYQSLFRVSKSLSRRLLQVFRQSGPFREMVLTVQKEMEEGRLLKDCLELGAQDLKGLIQVVRDMALQLSSDSGRSDL